jgi:hypothetical protein
VGQFCEHIEFRVLVFEPITNVPLQNYDLKSATPRWAMFTENRSFLEVIGTHAKCNGLGQV